MALDLPARSFDLARPGRQQTSVSCRNLGRLSTNVIRQWPEVRSLRHASSHHQPSRRQSPHVDAGDAITNTSAGAWLSTNGIPFLLPVSADHNNLILFRQLMAANIKKQKQKQINTEYIYQLQLYSIATCRGSARVSVCKIGEHLNNTLLD